MTRTIEELKQIFVDEHAYMLEHCFDTVTALANNPNRENAEELYAHLKKVAKERLDTHNLTDEEKALMLEHQLDWVDDTADKVLDKIKSNNN